MARRTPTTHLLHKSDPVPTTPAHGHTTVRSRAPAHQRVSAELCRQTCHFTPCTGSSQDLSARSNRCCAEAVAVTSSTASVWHHVCRSTSPAHVWFVTQTPCPRRTQAPNEHHLQSDISRRLFGRFHSSKALSGIFQTCCGHWKHSCAARTRADRAVRPRSREAKMSKNSVGCVA